MFQFADYMLTDQFGAPKVNCNHLTNAVYEQFRSVKSGNAVRRKKRSDADLCHLDFSHGFPAKKSTINYSLLDTDDQRSTSKRTEYNSIYRKQRTLTGRDSGSEVVTFATVASK